MRKTKEESKLRIDRITKLAISTLKLINRETKKLIKLFNNSYPKLKTNLNNINYNYICFPIYDKFYRVGSILTFIFVLPLAFISYKHSKGILFSLPNDGSFIYYLNIIFTWFVVISFIFGYVFESLEKLEKFYNKYKDKAVFKILVASLLFTVYSISEILISRFINENTDIDSKYFSDGKIVLKLFFIPYSWLLLALVYTLIKFIITVLLGFYGDIKPIIKSLLKLILLQTNQPSLSVDFNIAKINFTKQVKQLILILLISGSLLFFSIKDTFIQNIIKQVFIYSEYFDKTNCKNLQNINSLTSDIGGGSYSVYNKQSKTFTESKCEVARTKLKVK